MENKESQENELLALKYIYDERDFVVDGFDPPCGRFFANVRLPDSFSVISRSSQKMEMLAAQLTKSEADEVLPIQYLPPIDLFFRFPDSYPQETCPAFLLSCNWLTLIQLSKLCKHLEALWDMNKDAILYTWFQFLQEETLQFLNIEQNLHINELLNFKIKDNYRERELSRELGCNRSGFSSSSRAPIGPSLQGGRGPVDLRAWNDLADGKRLISLLKDFNEFKREEDFKNSIHECDICLLRKSGSLFVTFSRCKHTFCRDCVKEYFEQLIKDGNVNSLNCLDSKCESQADSSLVKNLVSPELFEKYDNLLLSRTLEGMDDIGYCPRQECQCPVLIDTCGRMGACPACKFVFCPFCKMAYHGVAPCNFKSVERQKIYQDYVNGTTAVKESIEKMYGKKKIKSLVEDTLSETWKCSNSKNCPKCRASIEKSDGCHKMTCYKCGAYFCWLCMKQLECGNPYKHYEDQQSRCFDQLFPDDYMDDEFEAGEFLNGFEPF